MVPARTKVTVACNNCQRRKIKCSGNKPCERCTKQGLLCRFLTPTKKRGPKRPSPSVIPDCDPHFQPLLKEYLQSHPDTEQELKDAFHGGESGELPEGAIVMLNGAANAMQEESREKMKAAKQEALMEPAAGYRAIQPRQHVVIFDDAQISSTPSLQRYDVEDPTDWTERGPRQLPSPTVNKQPILNANGHLACQAIPTVSVPSMSIRDVLPPTQINCNDVWTSPKRKQTITTVQKTEQPIIHPQEPIQRPQHQTTPPLCCVGSQRAVEPPHHTAQHAHHAQVLRRPDQPLHHTMQIRRHTEFPSPAQHTPLPFALPPTSPFNYPITSSDPSQSHHAVGHHYTGGASGLRAAWEPANVQEPDACGELINAKCDAQFQNAIVRLPHLETYMNRQ